MNEFVFYLVDFKFLKIFNKLVGLPFTKEIVKKGIQPMYPRYPYGRVY
jgi:hypothetical protein